MKITKMLLLGIVMGSAIVVARPAHATNLYVHGSSCFSQSTAVGYNQFGAFNSGATAATVYCPLNITTQSSSLLFVFQAYDRSTTADVSCTALAVAPDGTIVGSGTASTSGSGGGVMVVSSLFIASPGNHYWSLSCSIPPAGAGGTSFLTGVSLTY